MDDNTTASLEGELAANVDEQVSSTLITETYHSTIELGQFNGRIAIIKRCRHQHEPRTLPRFRNEVDALKLVSSHVSRLLHRGHSLSNTCSTSECRKTLRSSGTQISANSRSHYVPSRARVWTSTWTVIRSRPSPRTIQPHYGSRYPAH